MLCPIQLPTLALAFVSTFPDFTGFSIMSISYQAWLCESERFWENEWQLIYFRNDFFTLLKAPLCVTQTQDSL